MPKKIKFESFIYRFLIEASYYKKECQIEHRADFKSFLDNISFEYLEKKAVIKSNRNDIEVKIEVPLTEQYFYIRGDSLESINKQHLDSFDQSHDPVMNLNRLYFKNLVKKLFDQFLLCDSDSNVPT
jgi:hypothetical protein